MFRLAKGVYIPSFTAENRPNADQIVGLVLVDGVLNLSDGSAWSVVGSGTGGSASSTEITTSRSATSTDEILISNSASNLSITIDAGMPKDFGPLILVQGSTGTVQALEGSGVTFIGASRITALEGQKVVVMWIGSDKYSVQVVG